MEKLLKLATERVQELTKQLESLSEKKETDRYGYYTDFRNITSVLEFNEEIIRTINYVSSRRH